MRNYWQEYQLSKMRSNFLRTAAAVTGDKEKRKVKRKMKQRSLLIHLRCYLRYSGSGMMSAIATMCNGNIIMVIKAQSPAGFAEEYIIESIWNNRFPRIDSPR